MLFRRRWSAHCASSLVGISLSFRPTFAAASPSSSGRFDRGPATDQLPARALSASSAMVGDDQAKKRKSAEQAKGGDLLCNLVIILTKLVCQTPPNYEMSAGWRS